MNDPNAAFDGETEPVGMFCEHRGEIACLRQAAGCAQDSAKELARNRIARILNVIALSPTTAA